MKNLFAVMGLSMLFYSCSQDGLLSLDEKDMLSAELENVVEQFEESIKDEQTPTTQAEAFASTEELSVIRDSLRNVSSAYMSSKMRVSAVSDGTDFGTPKVGVFKVSSCGDYREFVYLMDCEDGGWSSTEGKVGTTFADGNKNIKFHFCLVPTLDYNGGVLLLSTYQWHPSHGNVDVVERYHDNEDNKNTNNVESSGGGPVINNSYPGHCRFSENTAFTWRFSERKTANLLINYGVLTNSFTTEDGRINIDDENGNNGNSAHLWRHKSSDGTLTERNLDSKERFRGITHSENTVYHIRIEYD